MWQDIKWRSAQRKARKEAKREAIEKWIPFEITQTEKAITERIRENTVCVSFFGNIFFVLF